MIKVISEHLPEMKGEIHAGGYDGRYRIYTVEHLAFDALPSYRDGGPARIALDGWSVSTSHINGMSSPSVLAADDGMYTLNLSHYPNGAAGERVRHELDGTKYPTDRDARRAAYDAGALGFMVYESQAARLGLPTVGDVLVEISWSTTKTYRTTVPLRMVAQAMEVDPGKVTADEFIGGDWDTDGFLSRNEAQITYQDTTAREVMDVTITNRALT